MSLRGISFVAHYYAWDTSAGTYKTGDSANHTLKWDKDGTNSTTTNAGAEVDATNSPGLYKATITSTEAQCYAGALSGKSSTANIILIGLSYTFVRLPDADPAANGGLPTVDASNNVHGLQTAPSDSTGVGTLLTRIASALTISGGKVAATIASGDFADILAARAAKIDHLQADQTGDAYVRLGAPAGATTAADIAAILTKTPDSAHYTNARGDLLANLDAAVSSRLPTSSYTTPPTAAAIATAAAAGILATPAHLLATDASGGVLVASTEVGAIDALSFASDALDAVRDAVLNAVADGTLTVKQLLLVIAAVSVGKASGAASTTITFRNAANTSDMVIATVDADGNRSAVTLNV